MIQGIGKRNPFSNFVLINYLFSATDIVKQSDKNKYVQHLIEQLYGILVIALLGISQYLVFMIVHHITLTIVRMIFQCSGPSDAINGRIDTAEKIFIIKFRKANTYLSLGLRYNADNSYFFVNGKESLNLKLIIKISIFLFSLVQKAYMKNVILMIPKRYLLKDI